MSEAQAVVAAVAPTTETEVTIHNSKDATLPKVFPFHFKKDELGNKRPSLNLILNVPTIEGIIQALSDPKQAEYIQEVLAQEIHKAARMQVGDDKSPVNKQEELNQDILSINALANMPKAERRGGGISKEVWEAFAKDYIEVMPGVTGKKLDNIVNASKIFIAKFQPAKTNKPVLKFLKTQLALWFDSTSQDSKEEFADCYEFLDNKVDTLLAADEASLLANL